MTVTLTPSRFDRIVAPVTRDDRIIWTAAAIDRRIGVGPDYVRHTLAMEPGSPVRKLGRRFYVIEDELIAFMRGRQTGESGMDCP